MNRNTLASVTAGALLALFAGCQPQEPAVGARSAPAVAEAQLADFVTEIERLVNGAAERVISTGSGSAGAVSLRAAVGRRVPDGEPLEREFDVSANGLTGSAQATGLAFTRPWPARYEMAFRLDGFSESTTLTANGALLYNFIRDDREAAALSDGLFRARLTPSGAFSGAMSTCTARWGPARSSRSSFSRAERESA